ncbi:DsbA family oxidoreductase [Streptomyces capparidis]
MRIEIWADVVCAWAYIGKRRLEAALRRPGAAPTAVEVVWRPLRIDPGAPAQAVPLEEALRDPVADEALRRCAPGLSPEENRVRVSRIAAEEGIGPRWGAVWRASSHDAHRLLVLALEHGGAPLQNRVAEEVMRAHFVEGADISSRRALDGIAARSGFAEGGALLATGAGEREVRELLLTGRARGIATSPTLVVGNRALAGAQPPETMAEFLAGGGPARPLPEEVRRLRDAESLLEQRDALGALTLLEPLLDAHGGDPGVLLLAARAYFHSAQLARARRTLERLVADRPDDSYARLLLGRTLQRQGLADQAAPHLRLAAAMTPDYA